MTKDKLATLSATTNSDMTEEAEGADADHTWDGWLLGATLALVAFGLVMQYSASAVTNADKFGNHWYAVSSQIPKLCIGLAAMVVVANLHYKWWWRGAYHLLGATLVLLCAVFIPGLGVSLNGSLRWIDLGVFLFQPAELAKLTMVVVMAYSVAKKGEKMREFVFGIVPHLVFVGMMAVPLLLQPDLGTTAILAVMMSVMVFVSGTKIRYLVGLASGGVALLAAAVLARPYRMERMTAFLDPWQHQQDAAYQITGSLVAIGSAGLTGRGLGEGEGKLGYVPELWNDFIATLIAEELGLLGIAAVVSLFLVLLWRGYRIAQRVDDAFGTYLAFGITTLIGMQACANLFVVTGLAPTKGLTLPLMSQGGSSLLLTLVGIGILLNISKRQPDRWARKRPERERRKEKKRLQKKRERREKRTRESDTWAG
jgi:cell division protein FtsW